MLSPFASPVVVSLGPPPGQSDSAPPQKDREERISLIESLAR